MSFHHFDVTKGTDTYRIVVEGNLADAEDELRDAFGFDTIKYLKTSVERRRDYHGDRKIGRCTVRAFWYTSRRGARGWSNWRM